MRGEHLTEVEIKLVVEDPSAVRRRLRQLSARAIRSVTLVDTYFELPWRPPGEGEMRLREVVRGDAHHELTLKGPPDADGDSRQEITTKISIPDAMAGILEMVGAVVPARIEKTRDEFSLDGVPVCLDDVAGLGYFVEIGAPVAQSEVASMKLRIRRVAEDLELDSESREQRSYLELTLLSMESEVDSPGDSK